MSLAQRIKTGVWGLLNSNRVSYDREQYLQEHPQQHTVQIGTTTPAQKPTYKIPKTPKKSGIGWGP